MYQKSNKRQQQAQETKHRIFTVAHRLFREKGFDSVTVEEIASASGMSVGAFYHHFKSKQEIMAMWHSVLDSSYMAFYNEIQKDPAFSGSVLAAIREFMLRVNEACIESGTDFTRVLYFYMISSVEFGNMMSDLNRSYFKIVHDLMEKGQQCGEIRSDIKIHRLVRDITIISRGCLVDYCIDGGSDSMREHFSSVLDCYLRGISSDYPKQTQI